MKPIIEVKNISKQYKIGQKQRYLSLRDSVTDFFRFRQRDTEGSDFWALDDVSFEVQAGESIGIIGRNGAGKSTLLKILSRITPPTKGNVILRGRIASLLEVGTGFHPELTGRENVFMNGSILGLRKAEIAQKFDEIVAFSGVEQFIDTPLKHYSSGMQLRLAFAVAAHLEPEILVIDEVLAVGDAEFQKKCLGKMDEVSKSGRTVLFVSHNLAAIRQLCEKSLILDKGKIKAIGDTTSMINEYVEVQDVGFSFVDTLQAARKKKSDYILIEAIALSDGKENKRTFKFNESLELNLHIRAFSDMKDVHAFILIKTLDGVYILSPFQSDVQSKFSIQRNEKIILKAVFNELRLLPGHYSIDIGLFESSFSFLEWIEDVIQFKIEETSLLHNRVGYVSPPVCWEIIN